jgi:hypothetical protein
MMAVKRKGSKYSGLPLKEKEVLEGLEKEGIEVDDLLEDESETELQLAPSPKPTTPKTKPKPTPLKTPLKKIRLNP